MAMRIVRACCPIMLIRRGSFESEEEQNEVKAAVTCFRSYPARFHMLAIFVLHGMVNQMMYLTFASIPDQTAARYNVSDKLVTGMAIECVVVYLPGAWITSRVLATSNLRTVVLVGCFLQVVGTILRFMADALVRPVSQHAGFAVLFAGQGLAGLASPAFINTPAAFSELWFNENQRDTAAAVGTLGSLLGQGIGSAMSGLMISDASGGGLDQLLGIQALVCALLALWAWCSFREAPLTPPSQSAASDKGESDVSTIAAWLQCLQRPQFLFICGVFVGGLGFATILLTLFAKIIGKCAYTSANAGVASLLFMFGGIFGSLASGAAMGATHAYKSVLRISISLSVAGGIVFMVSLQPDQLILLYTITTLFGMCALSLLPVLIACGVEETYPLPADASTSLLFCAAIIVQVPLTPFAEYVLDAEGQSCGVTFSSFKVFIYFLAIFVLLVPAWLYNGQYRRFQAERQPLASRGLSSGGVSLPDSS